MSFALTLGAGTAPKRNAPAAPQPAEAADGTALAKEHILFMERIAFLRTHERTPKADRAACIAYLLSAITSYRDKVELHRGHQPLDPDDEMTVTPYESVRILNLEFAELIMPGNPYPLLFRSDLGIFEQGRYFNGKFL